MLGLLVAFAATVPAMALVARSGVDGQPMAGMPGQHHTHQHPSDCCVGCVAPCGAAVQLSTLLPSLAPPAPAGVAHAGGARVQNSVVPASPRLLPFPLGPPPLHA